MEFICNARASQSDLNLKPEKHFAACVAASVCASVCQRDRERERVCLGVCARVLKHI